MLGRIKGGNSLTTSFLRINRKMIPTIEKPPIIISAYIKYSIKYFSIPKSESMQDNLMKHLIEYYKIKDNKFNVIHNESSGKKYELKNINGTNNIFVSKESDIYGNMLLYKKLIENAEEIHCINSSFIHLVERVNNIGKIYYHHIRKSKLFLKKRWKVINYED